MSPVSAADVEHYRRHGWIAPIDVMTETEANHLLVAFEEAERKHPQELNAEHRNNAHLVFPFLADLAAHTTILDAVEPLVGPDISLWSTVLFIKEPSSTAFVSWHQDAFYMGLAPDNFVTAWVALSESNADTGCVTVIPGSHHRVVEHHDTFGDDNILTRGQTVSNVDESKAVDLVLRPGQMSLHHPWLVHGSRPNTSRHRRVGLAMQSYLGADVRPTRGEHHVLPVRGNRPAAPFITVRPPSAACTPTSLDARRGANSAMASVLYDGADQVRGF